MAKIKGWSKNSNSTLSAYKSDFGTETRRMFVDNGWQVLYKNKKGYIENLKNASTQDSAKRFQLSFMRAHPNG